jgi:hypothetical protein
MSPDEYAIWQEADHIVRGRDKATSPCRDCTPLWHRDMDDAGMCDGVPGEWTAALPTQEEMARMGYAALKELRSRYPHNGPAALSLALYRARQRERERERRRRVPA